MKNLQNAIGEWREEFGNRAFFAVSRDYPELSADPRGVAAMLREMGVSNFELSGIAGGVRLWVANRGGRRMRARAARRKCEVAGNENRR